MELGGGWRAAPADEALRRAFPAADFDDAAWETIPVPGHWRSSPAFAASDGPVLHRRPFTAPAPAPGRRSWLTFEGLFYDGDVWLDGSYVGATEGYFFPHTFEVTEALADHADHVLAVEVGCARPTDRTAKRNLTGVFQHWDCLDPAWNPGGIWRPVRLSETGPVRISRLRVLCAEASGERAVLSVRAELDADAATPALIRVTVAGRSGAEQVTRHTLAHGTNRIRLRVTVDAPALWWPHALGDQPLHDVTVDVLVPVRSDPQPVEAGEEVTAEEMSGHVPSDGRTIVTGLRQVAMKRWVMTVNGERLFLKGSNHGPTRMALAEATPSELEQDVLLARQAGLDLLRIHAHVTRAELYDAADRHGLLLWQDLPLQWGYARSVRKQAVRQAREAVDLLGHHPAVALWCGHNEPLALDIEPGATDIHRARVVALQELPTWNKTVLDSSVSRALERADPTRPVVAHSGVWPGPLSGGTDAHLYFGWYHGEERDFPRALAAMPRLARFVTEFGAQAVPATAAFMEPERWPDLDWERLGRHHALQHSAFQRYVPPESYATFAAWQAATQAYQATVVRFHIEALRRLKYRPTGGFCQFCFADGHPSVTWSVLDHQRLPKAGYAALAAACAPVIVVAERPAPSYPPGAEIGLDIHVVSDLRRALPGARVTAVLGERRWEWGGDVPADSCVRIGTVRTVAPATVGTVPLVVALAAGEVRATNAYEVVVAAPD
jgi:beta-mannosidase